jgi:Asp/Glu/hydantoin racemase
LCGLFGHHEEFILEADLIRYANGMVQRALTEPLTHPRQIKGLISQTSSIKNSLVRRIRSQKQEQALKTILIACLEDWERVSH